MKRYSFAASINCIDGRVQGPVSDWIKSRHGVDYVDVISEPGCDLVLSRESAAEQSIRDKLRISITAHKTAKVFISGHHECAANPVSASEHKDHTRLAVQRIRSWNLPVEVYGLWVDESWQVGPIPMG